MPSAPPHPCTHPGCHVLVYGPGRCEKHRKQESRDRESKRLTSSERGYGIHWQRTRRFWLASNPLCVTCQVRGALVPATVVDHIKPHKGDQALFWDPENWQALCKTCHDSKTAREDGRWGREW